MAESIHVVSLIAYHLGVKHDALRVGSFHHLGEGDPIFDRYTDPEHGDCNSDWEALMTRATELEPLPSTNISVLDENGIMWVVGEGMIWFVQLRPREHQE